MSGEALLVQVMSCYVTLGQFNSRFFRFGHFRSG